MCQLLWELFVAFEIQCKATTAYIGLHAALSKFWILAHYLSLQSFAVSASSLNLHTSIFLQYHFITLLEIFILLPSLMFTA